MPMYEYACRDCGTFSAMRRMAECSQPTDCPDCGAASARIISAPRLSLISSHARVAHETNERSADRPHTSKTYDKRHPAGCGCCSSSSRKASNTWAPPAIKTKTGPRPWMISH